MTISNFQSIDGDVYKPCHEVCQNEHNEPMAIHSIKYRRYSTATGKIEGGPYQKKNGHIVCHGPYDEGGICRSARDWNAQN